MALGFPTEEIAQLVTLEFLPQMAYLGIFTADGSGYTQINADKC
ncbi:hypothetical protein [Microcoleus sp. POL10_C6]